MGERHGYTHALIVPLSEIIAFLEDWNMYLRKTSNCLSDFRFRRENVFIVLIYYRLVK